MKRLYAIEYGTKNFDNGKIEDLMVCRLRAYDYESAVERFYDKGDDDGFIPVRVALIEGKENRSHEWRWIQVPQ